MDYIIEVGSSVSTVGMEAKSISHEDVAGAQCSPKGRTCNCQCPKAVLKSVLGQEEGVRRTCQYPLVRFDVDMNCALSSVLISSTTRGVE